MSTQQPIGHISDTARWAAVYRAREAEQARPLFVDAWAARLAGDHMSQPMPFHDESAWAWATRTFLFDHYITEQVQKGVDVIVNLAAGLDARPYRMALPPTVRWIEVDLPEILDYKARILPSGGVERVRLDLRNVDQRRSLFGDLRGQRTLVVSEGLLIYLSAEEVAGLAVDLASHFGLWVTDLLSPGLLKIVQQSTESSFTGGVATAGFAPLNGPQFFVPHGWRPVSVGSMLGTAADLGRLPPALLPLTVGPENPSRMGDRPWAGVCLFKKAESGGSP